MPTESTIERGQAGDENRTAIRCLFERVYSKGELHRINDVVTSDFTGESNESSRAHFGPDGVKTHVVGLRTAFNKFTIVIDDLHVRGDSFEVSWTARGNHERRFRGIDPTCNIGQAGEEPHGNRIAVSGDSSGTIRNGKIHDSRMVWDVEELRQQLGTSIEDLETDTGAGEWTGQNPLRLEGKTGVKTSTRSVGSIRGV